MITITIKFLYSSSCFTPLRKKKKNGKRNFDFLLFFFDFAFSDHQTEHFGFESDLRFWIRHRLRCRPESGSLEGIRSQFRSRSFVAIRKVLSRYAYQSRMRCNVAGRSSGLDGDTGKISLDFFLILRDLFWSYERKLPAESFSIALMLRRKPDLQKIRKKKIKGKRKRSETEISRFTSFGFRTHRS